MRKPKPGRMYEEELQTFTRVVTVQKSGGKSSDRKRRNKTYHQVYYKWVRVPVQDVLNEVYQSDKTIKTIRTWLRAA